MSKAFFEVFPTLKLRGELRDLFEDTQVTRIVWNKAHTKLKVCLESHHLIHHKFIAQMEQTLTETVMDGDDAQVVLSEHYVLSAQYNCESLFHAYYDSLQEEMWQESPVLGSFFRDASFSFPEPDVIELHVENTGMAKDSAQTIRGRLLQIFEERCGMGCEIHIVCDLPARKRARSTHAAQNFPAGSPAAASDSPAVVSDIPAFAPDSPAAAPEPPAASGGPAAASDSLSAAAASSDPSSAAVARRSAAAAESPAGAGRTGKDAGKGSSTSGRAGKGRKGREAAAGGASPRDQALRGFLRSNNPDVICGKEFDDPAIPISDITGEIGEVTIRGKILSNERRDIRNDKSILKFVLTDFTDSISVKIFAPTLLADETMARLGKGAFVKVKGTAKEDTFEHETVISSPFGILSIPSFEERRKDTYDKKRVELHLHTKMSDMDGVSECKDLVKRAYDWGWPAVAITDHGNVQAFPDANHLVEDLLKKENARRKEAQIPSLDRQDFFKVIYGVECYLVDDEKKMVMFGDTGRDPAFAGAADTGSRPQSAADAGMGSLLQSAADPQDYDIRTGRFVIFDIETTGFSSDRDRIIEIGAVRYENGEKTGDFSEFVNPGIPIPYKITQLTSIRDDMVIPADPIEKVLPRFLDFCRGCVLVGHNVGFDIGFIRQNARNLGLDAPFTTIDTIGMARVMFPGHKSYNLDAVGKLLNVVNPHHHRAVDDAQTTAEIFIKLLAMFTQKGAVTLGGMNALADENPDIIRRLRPYHCILLAKNTTGRTNLYRLISASHLTYYYQKPKIPKSLLSQHREGLIVGSACAAGELMQALIDDRGDETVAGIVKFYDYLEIQPRGNNRFLIDAKRPDGTKRYEHFNSEEDLLELNRKVVRLGERFGKLVVATGDVHFLDPEDQISREIIMNGITGNREEEPAPLYLRTTDEMMEEFAYLGPDKCEEVVITNPNRIAGWVDAIAPVRPDKCPPVIENSDKQLREICLRQAHRVYGDPLPEIVEERLERELNSIIRNGYSVMYIIAQKLVWKSNEDGYLVGSRGSVGSSFAATMAGITEVNPLPPHYVCPNCHWSDFDSSEVKAYAGRCGIDMPDRICPKCGEKLTKAGVDIPFETFLGFKGNKEPDIDLNFSGEYQAKAHAYTKVIFGHEQTFKAGTIATVAEKTAYGYTLGYCERHGLSKRKCEMERLSAGCVGVRRSTGQHPGGIVVLPLGEEIHTFTPVQHPANDMTTDIVTTHFDYHSIDHNLLKLDILGHDDPTMIRMLQDITGRDPLALPLDDKGVMQLFTGLESLGLTPEQDGGIQIGTLGVPEFGTRFVMGMLQDTRPTTFSELVKISGLSHGTDVWIGNASDLIASGTCTLSTCIGCRDDIMTYLINMGEEPSMAFNTMENVRKGKGLKPDMEEAMEAVGVPDWYKGSCLKIKYMFPKGHAVAYVTMALRIAWFKVHEPLAYYCAYYSIRAKSFDYEMMAQGKEHLLQVMQEYQERQQSSDPRRKLTAAEEAQYDDALLVREMYARGIEFTPIKLGVAKGRQFIIVDGKIMPSYNSIHGMGTAAADSLEEACRQGDFVSRQDLRERAKISQTIADKMAELGILGNLPETNQFSLFDIFGTEG